MCSSMGSWTPDFNTRARFCVCVCVCLIDGKLPYSVALVSVVKHRKSAVTIHIPPPSRASLPPPKPLWVITEPGWAPYVTQQHLTSYLFTPDSVYMSMLLSLFVPLSTSLTASTSPFFLYESFGLQEHSGWMLTERQIPPGWGSHDPAGVIQDPLATEEG